MSSSTNDKPSAPAAPNADVKTLRPRRYRSTARKLITLSPTLPVLLTLATGCSLEHDVTQVFTRPKPAPAATSPDSPDSPEAIRAKAMVDNYMAGLNSAMGKNDPGLPAGATTQAVVRHRPVVDAGPTPLEKMVETVLAQAEAAIGKYQQVLEARERAELAAIRPPVQQPATMDALMAMLRQRAEARPQQINYALALRLLELAEPNGASTALRGLSANDQKLVDDVANAVQAVSAKPAGLNDTLAERAGPLVSASQSWAVSNDLELPRLLLASRVDSFGTLTQVDAKFSAGESHPVVVYCEVANFVSKREKDVYVTRLTQQETLLTGDGLLVYRANPVDVEDTCLAPRKDFYLAKRMTIPDTLAVGKYMLRMSVTDNEAGKIAQATIPIEIVGK